MKAVHLTACGNPAQNLRMVGVCGDQVLLGSGRRSMSAEGRPGGTSEHTSVPKGS